MVLTTNKMCAASRAITLLFWLWSFSTLPNFNQPKFYILILKVSWSLVFFLLPPSSTLHPLSSILHPPYSILHPPSTILKIIVFGIWYFIIIIFVGFFWAYLKSRIFFLSLFHVCLLILPVSRIFLFTFLATFQHFCFSTSRKLDLFRPISRHAEVTSFGWYKIVLRPSVYLFIRSIKPFIFPFDSEH